MLYRKNLYDSEKRKKKPTDTIIRNDLRGNLKQMVHLKTKQKRHLRLLIFFAVRTIFFLFYFAHDLKSSWNDTYHQKSWVKVVIKNHIKQCELIIKIIDK